MIQKTTTIHLFVLALSAFALLTATPVLAGKPDNETAVCHIGSEEGPGGETYDPNCVPTLENDYFCADAGKIDLIKVPNARKHLGKHEYGGLSDYLPGDIGASGIGQYDEDGDGIDQGCQVICPCWGEAELAWSTTKTGVELSGACDELNSDALVLLDVDNSEDGQEFELVGAGSCSFAQVDGESITDISIGDLNAAQVEVCYQGIAALCDSIPVYCGLDEYVSNNVCTACPDGTTNAAGDDASGSDTECDVIVSNPPTASDSSVTFVEDGGPQNGQMVGANSEGGLCAGDASCSFAVVGAGTSGTITLTVADPGQNIYAYTEAVRTTAGELTWSADGSFSFEPAGDWYGETSFDFKTQGSTQQSDTATLTITVPNVVDQVIFNFVNLSLIDQVYGPIETTLFSTHTYATYLLQEEVEHLKGSCGAEYIVAPFTEWRDGSFPTISLSSVRKSNSEGTVAQQYATLEPDTTQSCVFGSELCSRTRIPLGALRQSPPIAAINIESFYSPIRGVKSAVWVVSAECPPEGDPNYTELVPGENVSMDLKWTSTPAEGAMPFGQSVNDDGTWTLRFMRPVVSN